MCIIYYITFARGHLQLPDQSVFLLLYAIQVSDSIVRRAVSVCIVTNVDVTVSTNKGE